MEQVSIALFLAVANKSIIDNVFAPVKEQYPNLKWWWVIYVSLVTGFAISWFCEFNVFTIYISNPMVGRILTGFVVGGGSSLIHDIFDRKDS